MLSQVVELLLRSLGRVLLCVSLSERNATTLNFAVELDLRHGSVQDLEHPLDKAIEAEEFLRNDHDVMRKKHELSSERLRSEILDLKAELLQSSEGLFA
ncbi:Aste57867_18227 [Aphanomyces stellatus]|uniref:Aste57867_18227 protein n=1 Tax=Aphanomyces stellatus TaxID=120398 RepID=A0A485LD94_9STRA|nr:hypothetical protein As57867_018165 [Aphanomyces stellatus]VFT94965.1 Aste57867_18227 [Aphanomyces stellatus]